MKVWVLIATWGALLLPRPGQAQTSAETARVALHWSAAPDASACLQPETVQQRVEAQLGHSVFVTAGVASDVTLNVDAQCVESAIHVELELQRAGESLGNRSLEGNREECAKLVDSLVVVIALLVDVQRANAEPARPPEAEPPKAPSPARATNLRPATAPPRASNHLALNARAMVASGILPSTAFGFGLDARASFALAPTLAWRLGGDYLPRDRVSAQGGQVSASALSWQFGFSPLELTGGSAIHFRPWALASVAMIAARGEGFAESRSGYRWVPALSLSGSVEWRLARRLWLSAEPVLGFALARPSFVYDDPAAGPQTLFQPDFLLFSANLGLTWQFF